jgi:regulator of nonsense transcripts 2
MMAESLDSRKFERKSMFDVPLPIRKVQRDRAEALDDEDEASEVEVPPLNTMAFSLMTKKGNRQQVRRSFALTSDSIQKDVVSAHTNFTLS